MIYYFGFTYGLYLWVISVGYICGLYLKLNESYLEVSL